MSSETKGDDEKEKLPVMAEFEFVAAIWKTPLSAEIFDKSDWPGNVQVHTSLTLMFENWAGIRQFEALLPDWGLM